MLPLFQFPNIGAYRTDKVDGHAERPGELPGVQQLVELRGPRRRRPDHHRRRAVPGPDCINPDHRVRQLVVVPVGRQRSRLFPSMCDTTNDGRFEPSEFLTGEAVVEVG